MRRSALALFFIATGCGAHAVDSSAHAPQSSPATRVAPAAKSAPLPRGLEQANTSEIAVPDAAGYLGVIDRAGLNSIVDAGLGRMLARLKLSPELDGKRFVGFRITELEEQWLQAGLQIGDVIQRLNGHAIERPEQALVAFESLRVSSEVAVELLRNGQTTWLRYRVE